MRVKVARWGNSTAVRLPKEAVRALAVEPGEELEMTVDAGVVAFEKPVSRYMTLAQMVAEMKRLGPDAEPATVDWGPDVGSEVLPDEDWSELRDLPSMR